jgi:hypothetical protein
MEFQKSIVLAQLSPWHLAANSTSMSGAGPLFQIAVTMKPALTLSTEVFTLPVGAPLRSLLDPDFTSGSPEQGCEFTNFTFNYSVTNRPKPPKVVNVRLEVRYSSTPNAHAVDEARKQVDTRTY